jgi:hypothetical protein
MIKKILPIENIHYLSTLNKEELITLLKKEIDSNNLSTKNHENYIGKIFANKFELKKVINYKNSFLPVINGEIVDGLNGAKIHVKMKLIGFVKVFIIFWLSMAFIAFITSLVTFLCNDISITIILIPLIMLIFGIALTSIGFKSESKKSIKDLEEILKAKIINNDVQLYGKG